MSIESRLNALNIVLPTPTTPAANYLPYVVTGNQLYISGQLPMENGAPAVLGKLGGDVSLQEGQRAARLCAINILAQAQAALGDLAKIKQVVRLGGFVNSTPDFTEQPAVINGASDLMAEVLGAAGRHARAAVGVAALPRGVAVEIDAIFAV